MSFVAFLDTCVLYPPYLRDVLLSIAEAGVFQVRWSPDVLDELERALARRAKVASPDEALHGAKYTRGEMEAAFPDAMVDKTSYKALIPAMTNDQKDRHVLAAAIAGKADALVTNNLKDFPPESAYEIEVLDPDSFLVFQFDLARDRIIENLSILATKRHPPLSSVEDILGAALVKSAPRFASIALEYWQERKGHP